MKTHQNLTSCTAITLIMLSLGGCAGMSPQGRNTAIGAGVGAIGGSVLTGGSALGTVGGAAVGGIIGHEVRH
ncbi:glycine zipper 2TM domain-containing protein [Crenobacter sp. SG2303]|uniref:Glycine zipper 2TM domain-containing protein n=1 Tax=Crenobacter oryzisoli TaxID=3056844 RepID=A0ABT7XQR7_9NEIS|nr:glycine zipper 2TM domain-containing protein [Crenobacter sp. SG2303]MDN0076141.1 glycine zipper 2TM domain-containing protein [Crenobacter sp. SG2303]